MQRSQSWIIPTVMSPEKGGPVYNQLRANFAYTRRMIQRHPFRWIHDNWDFERQALINVPEPNLEIRKNQWMHFVDAVLGRHHRACLPGLHDLHAGLSGSGLALVRDVVALQVE